MNVKVSPAILLGTLHTVSSKSLSHRALIAASLAEGTSVLHNLLDADDITATKQALSKFSVKFNGSEVDGGFRLTEETTIDCYESGSTLRFMIPLALMFQHSVTFTGRNRLPLRPLTPYESLFKNNETFMSLSTHALPLRVKGPLKPRTFTLAGNISSQFITGLLFALPCLKEDSVIKLTSPLESKGYVDLTLDVLESFKVSVTTLKDGYLIKGNQHYKAQTYTVEGDYSQAAFFIVAALLNGNLTLKNLNPSSKQGDKAIVDIVRAMQGTVNSDELDTLTVKKSQTKGTVIKLNDIPDLGPILMMLAAMSSGITTFYGVERLRLKESDRLEAMMAILQKLGISYTYTNDCLKVTGTDQFKGNLTLSSYNDHRIAMAIAVAALRADGPIIIQNAECISKSYPSFFEDYQMLGGRVEKEAYNE